MKAKRYRSLFLFISIFSCWLIPCNGLASVEVDGIYYELNTTNKTAEVATSNRNYTGIIEIPKWIEYEMNYYDVTSIGSYAFSECDGLTSVTIPSSVRTIGDYAFWFCYNLTSVNMPNRGLKHIGECAFENCIALTSVVIPREVSYIGGGAFGFCDNLSSVTIPSGKIYIENGAFQNTCNLSTIKLENRSPDDYSFNEEGGAGPFYYSIYETCTLYVPSGSRSSYESAYLWRNFHIEESDYLINGPCGDNLTYTVYPDMTMIISGTGDMCDSSEGWNFNEEYFSEVKKVIVEEGVASIGWYAFCDYRSLSSISLPNSLEFIGYYAFLGCDNLTALSIPRNVTEFGTGISSLPILTSSELSSITVDPNNPVYDSRDNCNAVIRTSNNVLEIGCKNTVIPNSVTKIGHKSFSYCNGLTSIEIPNSVTTIDWYAFFNCANLVSISIPSSVTIIYSQAFEGTPWYDNQPDGLLYINDVAYRYKGTMPENTSLTLREGTVSISSNAFTNCTNLVSVNIPNSVVSIGSVAFYNCSSLTSITIPNSVTSLGDNAFSGCTGLSSVIMEINTPISITGQTFSKVNKSTCTLYVPYGSKSAYENAQYWNEFENIIEYDPVPDTDISALANAIYVEQVEGRIGGTKDISIRMKNSYPIRGFQFKLELPEGTTINGWSLSTDRLPSGATTSDKVGTQRIDGNKINVACSLNYGDATFTGSDGEIATINVTFGEGMEAGSYAIYLTECDVNDAAGTDEGLSDIKSTLILEDYVPGDANGDGLVRIGDTTTILNYIVGNASQNFQVKAADVNGDGLVRIGDVTAVLNIIVSQ